MSLNYDVKKKYEYKRAKYQVSALNNELTFTFRSYDGRFHLRCTQTL